MFGEGEAHPSVKVLLATSQRRDKELMEDDDTDKNACRKHPTFLHGCSRALILNGPNNQTLSKYCKLSS